MTTQMTSSPRKRRESGAGSTSSAVGFGSFCAGGFSELVPLDGNDMINRLIAYPDLLIFFFDTELG